MFHIKRVIDFMERKFDVAVELNAIGEEIVLLYHEELDKKIISEDVLKILPNPILFHTYIYNEESEWIIGIALEAKTNNPLFLVCLKDGVRVYEQYLSERKNKND
ncbi:hypothetical protein [Bacillus cereus]|uniref:hypothetical protein n=1 Tax=Bacillus cereus TaxID=1396 RepID=UPI0001A0619F|nr:hypothetical protein [Bacillus cereus]EEK91919.1 hypothetical protein bcere0012_51240 [Bacillus cereus BDRD-ST24]MCD1205827.1 hypothetical protein [Bacillus cereus]HDR4548696.1 hypothetical protein [Bacillus cereus]